MAVINFLSASEDSTRPSPRRKRTVRARASRKTRVQQRREKLPRAVGAKFPISMPSQSFIPWYRPDRGQNEFVAHLIGVGGFVASTGDAPADTIASTARRRLYPRAPNAWRVLQ